MTKHNYYIIGYSYNTTHIINNNNDNNNNNKVAES